MSKNKVDRRDFLKFAGVGSAALGVGLAAPKLIAKTANGFLVESEKEYGGFHVEKLSKGKFPYEYKPDVLKRMREKYTVFSRSSWDPVRREVCSENVKYNNLVKGKGVVPNQTRLDYAFTDASWCLAHNPYSYQWGIESGSNNRSNRPESTKWNPADINMSWEEVSVATKHAALVYGASLAGIAEINPLWIYDHRLSPTREDRERAIPVKMDGERFEKTQDAWYVPKSMNRVIALAFEEDYDAIMNSPGRLASGATGNGYTRMAVTSYAVAQYIRNLGYRAIPAGNGFGLSIPIAIVAGLGELGRNGLIVTPKYGPRVRLAKVLTDMPLIADSPIRFGVKEFCEKCMLCAEQCPSNSISTEGQTWEGKSKSNNNGTLKWYIEPEPCNDYNGFSCSNCKRCCPFNKPNNSWLHRMIRTGINAKSGLLDKFMVSLDQASGYGVESQATEFWKKDGSNSITSREPKTD